MKDGHLVYVDAVKYVSTWRGDGHIHAGGYGQGAGSQKATAKHRREATHCRRDVGGRSLGSARSTAHGVNANQVFYWRKLYQSGRLGVSGTPQLLPVRVTAESTLAKTARKPRSSTPIVGSPTRSEGLIYMELRQAQVRIEGVERGEDPG